MSLAFLRIIDKLLGGLFLFVLVTPVRCIGFFVKPRAEQKPRHVFIKLKGGGSLIIALPALLGLRRNNPEAEFILVCAAEAKIYAEMTGAFDRFVVIDDKNIFSLVRSGFCALADCFGAAQCVDIEPNSLLAAVFTMLTCATRRIGFVKPSQPSRHYAYSDSIAFDPLAPVYTYYDQICALLGGSVASAEECRDAIRAQLPPPLPIDATQGSVIAIAAFTSDFARERMMPVDTWVRLLRAAYENRQVTFLIFGAMDNNKAAVFLGNGIQTMLPQARIINLAGAGSLPQAVARLALCDEVWAVDSGLLHMTRALGVKSRSFWGPTMPSQRLRPIENLQEKIHYHAFACSPCVQIASGPPCRGQNKCMGSMDDEAPDLHPVWAQK